MLNQSAVWLSVVLVMGCLTLVIHLLSVLGKIYNLDREHVRKALHLIMGTITLTFPWIFHSSWPVLLLSLVSTAFITFIKTRRIQGWSKVVEASGRKSLGETFFPLSVGLIFYLSGGDKFLYLTPIAILTYADSASALIGMHFGKRKYFTVDGQKSGEGSLAFLLIAFLTTLLLSTTFGGFATIHAVLLSLVVAIIAMLFEGISWRGLDNLLIPMGSLLAIHSHSALSFHSLRVSFFALALMAIVFIAMRKRSTLTGSAILGVVLFSYFANLYGGPLWTLSPVLLFLTYKYLLPRRYRSLRKFHSIYGVLAVAVVGMFWLFMAIEKSDPRYLFPYTLAFAAHAAIIATAHMHHQPFETGFIRAHGRTKGRRGRLRLRILSLAVFKAWCLMCIPFFFASQDPLMIWLNIAFSPICIGIPTLMFYLSNSDKNKSLSRPGRWFKQASFASLGAGLGLIPLLI